MFPFLRNTTIVALLLVVTYCGSDVAAFSVSDMKSRATRSRLQASFHEHQNDENSPEAILRQRTCIRTLLTQRAIQSFMDLLISIRDPHTADWLQLNLNANNLEYFHGTGAFNMTKYPTWDAPLLDVLSKPNDVVIVTTKSRRANGGGGWRGQIGGWQNFNAEQPERKVNPYLQEKVIETELEIEPASLVSRIVSVREQLANEFVADFDSLIYANDQILASYFETQESLGLNDFSDTVTFNDDNMEDYDSSTLSAPYSGTPTRREAFERHVGDILVSNAILSKDSKSSPLRKGNFDLMFLLATQESIHRVLRSYAKAGNEREVSFVWLRDFYTKRVGEYFDGHQQSYGRADDFLTELLLTPPVMKTLDNSSNSRNEEVGLVDPLRIAEDIIRTRSEVGEEWKEIIASVPKEHTELRKLLLAKQMGKNVEINVPTMSDLLDANEGFQ